MLLELIWLTVVVLNIIPFGSYILYMKKVADKKPWNIKADSAYLPEISIVIPTFEEGITIVRKLDNIGQVDYPKEKMEVTIVDSCSKDQTTRLAQEWSKQHPEIRLQIICQPERRGMVNALNYMVGRVHGEIFVKTDADCLIDKDSLRNAVKYFADPQVGAVAGIHIIDAHRETSSVKTERTYRQFYRWLRIGESKLYGTVLYEGELMLVRTKILDKIHFDEEIGADDVPIALRIAEEGYRAITAEDANFLEQTPYTWKEKFRQKIRRGRHVFQALWKYKYLMFKKKTPFHQLILPAEFFIHIVNPFVTIAMLILSLTTLIIHPWFLVLTIPLLNNKVRSMFITFIVNNCIMFLAVCMEARSREKTTWTKIDEIRKM